MAARFVSKSGLWLGTHGLGDSGHLKWVLGHLLTQFFTPGANVREKGGSQKADASS